MISMINIILQLRCHMCRKSADTLNAKSRAPSIPERQCVVSHKCLALSDQEGPIRSAGLQAVLGQ